MGWRRRDDGLQETPERCFTAAEIDAEKYHDLLAALRSMQAGRRGR